MQIAEIDEYVTLNVIAILYRTVPSCIDNMVIGHSKIQ